MTEVPSIIEQAHPFRAGFFNFGKAKRDDVTYFNPCILARSDADWLIVRRAIWRPGLKMGQNGLMAFRLSAGLVPEVGFKISMPGSESEHFEDPRCTVHDNTLWISACNFLVMGPNNSRWTGAHQVICKVSNEWAGTERFDPVYGKNGPGLQANIGHPDNPRDIHEKNWLWFSHEGDLHMIYRAVPHEVSKWTNDVKFTGEEWKTEPVVNPWRFGELRGGCNPVRVGNEYWTFFHSSLPWDGKKRQYYMGAYSFEAKPPFRMLRMTPRPLLAGSTLDEWLPGKPPCVFPCGAIIRNGRWLVVGGSNDLSCFWYEIPHADLEKRTVSTIKVAPKKAAGWLTKATEVLTSPP